MFKKGDKTCSKFDRLFISKLHICYLNLKLMIGVRFNDNIVKIKLSADKCKSLFKLVYFLSYFLKILKFLLFFLYCHFFFFSSFL